MVKKKGEQPMNAEELKAMEEAETVRDAPTLVPEVMDDDKTVEVFRAPEGVNEAIEVTKGDAGLPMESDLADREASTNPEPEAAPVEEVEPVEGLGEAVQAEAGEVDVAEAVIGDVSPGEESIEDFKEAARAESGNIDVSEGVMDEVAATDAARDTFSRAAELGFPDLAGVTLESWEADQARAEELQKELDGAGFFSRMFGKGAQKAEMRQIQSRLNAVDRLMAAAEAAVPFQEDGSGGKGRAAEGRARREKASKDAGRVGRGR